MREMRPNGNQAGPKAKSASTLRMKQRRVHYVHPTQCVSSGWSARACFAGKTIDAPPAAEAGRNGDPVTNIAETLCRSAEPLGRAKRHKAPLRPLRAGSERQQNAAGCAQRHHASKGDLSPLGVADYEMSTFFLKQLRHASNLEQKGATNETAFRNLSRSGMRV